MGIIEQIDARFQCFGEVILTEEWRLSIKAEIAKSRKDALEEAAKAIEANKYGDLVKAEIREPLNCFIDICAKQIRVCALKEPS